MFYFAFKLIIFTNFLVFISKNHYNLLCKHFFLIGIIKSKINKFLYNNTKFAQ